jgi:hypothetical protein
MRTQLELGFSGGRVPDTRRRVVRGCGDPPSVRAPGEALDRIDVALQLEEQVPGRDVEDEPFEEVERSYGDAVPVRAEGRVVRTALYVSMTWTT